VTDTPLVGEEVAEPFPKRRCQLAEHLLLNRDGFAVARWKSVKNSTSFLTSLTRVKEINDFVKHNN
jgi:hypothetical protein